MLDTPYGHSQFKAQVTDNGLQRESIIESLNMHLEDNNVIVIKGKNGIGKSFLLHQLALSNSKNTIAIFIKDTEISSTLEDRVFRDLYIQITSYLKDTDFHTEEVTYDLLSRKISTLRYMKNVMSQDKLIFILDGFECLDKTNYNFLEKILDLIPLDGKKFGLVLTGNKDIAKWLDDKHNLNQSVVDFQMPLLSDQESRSFLNNIDEKDIVYFLSKIRKTPEALTIINKLLERGIATDEILNSYTAETSQLYDLEWSLSRDVFEGQEFVLSVIANSSGILSQNDVCGISDAEYSIVDSLIRNVDFIEINSDGYVVIVSRPYIKLIRAQTNDIEQEVISRTLLYLSGASQKSNQNITHLTTLLKSSGNNQKLLEHLNRDNLIYIAENTVNNSDFLMQLEAGFTASQSVSDIPTMVGFSLLKGFTKNIENTKSREFLIDTCLVENDIVGAEGYAASIRISEDKLKFLCRIARYDIEKNGLKKDYIIEQIYILLDGLDCNHISLERRIDLALDLLSIDPAKSMDLINSFDGDGRSGENKQDYAFLHLTLKSFLENDFNIDALLESDTELDSRKIELLKSFAMAKGSHRINTRKILSDAKEIITSGEKIQTLQNWVKLYAHKEDIFSLLDQLLDIAIEETKYTINSEFLKDIASGLNKIVNPAESEALYKKLLIQFDISKNSGPTIEHVMFMLKLAEHDLKTSGNENRFKDVKDFVIHNVKDKSTSLNGLLLLQGALVDSSIFIYDAEIEEIKERLVITVLNDTVEHDILLMPSVRLQSKINLRISFEWCKRMNLQNRRDKSIRNLVIYIFKNHEEYKIIDTNLIEKNIHKIEDDAKKSQTIHAYFKYLSTAIPKKIRLDHLKSLKNKIVSSTQKVKVLSLLYIILKKSTDNTFVREVEVIEDDILNSLGSISNHQKLVQIVAEIYNNIYSVSPEFAIKVKSIASKYLEEGESSNFNFSEGAYYMADLAIRSAQSLIRHSLLGDHQLEILISAINIIESPPKRALLLCRLISYYQLYSNITVTKSLFEKNIFPALQELYENKDPDFDFVLLNISPVLFIHSAPMFRQYFGFVLRSYEFRDNIIISVFRYIKTKTLPNDPFKPVTKYKYGLTYTDICNLLELVSFLEEDNKIFSEIDSIKDLTLESFKERNLSEPQLNSVIEKISSFKDSMFGNDSRFIVHAGYLICTESILLNLKRCKVWLSWSELLTKATEIPNIADSVFTKITILDNMPTSLRQKKEKLAKDIEKNIDCLSTLADKVNRLEYFASVLSQHDKLFSKRMIKKFAELSLSEVSDESDQSIQGIVDLAYSIDSEYANDLSRVINVDAAKKKMLKNSLSRSETITKSGQNFLSNPNEYKNEVMKDGVAQKSWEILGKINAKNYRVKKSDKIDGFLDLVSEYSPHYSYPVFSLYLTLLDSKCNNPESTLRYAKPNFEKILENITITCKFYDSRYEIKYSSRLNGASESGNFIVDESSKGLVSKYRADWIESVNPAKLNIIDPYFELPDLVGIANAVNFNSDIKISLLISEKSAIEIEKQTNKELDKAIIQYWLDNIFDAFDIDLTIICIGIPSKKLISPIHDRHWLTSDGGLRFGTSGNGLGARISEISKVSKTDASLLNEKYQGYFDHSVRMHQGEKLKIRSFVVI